MPDTGTHPLAHTGLSECLPALGLDLATTARNCPGSLVFIDATGDRIDSLAAAVAVFDPALEVLALPAPDSLPYDRTTPSAGVTGRRVATFSALAAAPNRPRLVITSARAMMTKAPPPSHWAGAAITLQAGQPVQPDTLAEQLRAWGYVADEHVDEPGQFAMRGHVIDLFPGDAAFPFRLAVAEDGLIQGVHHVDAASQRSDGPGLPGVTLRPVREEAPELVGVLAYLADATILLHPEIHTCWTELAEQVADAHAATLRVRRAGEDGPPAVPPMAQLFCTAAELEAAVQGCDTLAANAIGRGVTMPASNRVAAAAIGDALAGGRVVIAAGDAATRLHASLARRGAPVWLAPDWEAALAGPVNTAAITHLSLGSGFARPQLTVLALAAPTPPADAARRLIVEEPPRFGDFVVHADRGVCRLRGLAAVDASERVALEFADDTELLIPIEELNQVWRYGSDEGHIALDHVDGAAWRRRRAIIAAEIADTAREIAAASAARAALRAPAIHPPAAAFGRFVRRFAFGLSPDQADAIDHTLADLASGRPMDRLVCGDVGFGKTEVALRAAAAVALTGRQVAIAAPTTVLARQHYDSFTRRFAGLGVRVAPLLRGAASADGRAVREALADGGIHIVIGTQAVAAPAIRFKNLALVVIDEEQRFGEADKKRLAALRNPDGGVHALVMTATPIPRTLQGAMVGLRDVSVIATPPVRRQPIRTFVLPWEPVVVREALMREHARGGQSFIVCPRIEDLAPIAARLADLAPELSVVRAHGRMKPAELEHAVAGFAAGHGDVLLATNIIEAGLDISRANTILVTRPDRFGLAQLHQMRGRVGRGERRGSAYLLSEPGAPLSATTQRRLRTLAAQTQLGAGVAISLADMDARGAGDLFGDRQAGHVRAIGTELYQRMLVAAIDGRTQVCQPQLHTELSARIPEALAPEPNLRLDLYRRLSRLDSAAAADDFVEELADRFGELPAPVLQLVDLARLRVWCVARGVSRLDAGPNAVALSLPDGPSAATLADALGGAAKANRVILPIAIRDPAERLGRLCEELLGR